MVLAEAVARLLAYSDEVDKQLRLRLAAWREGFAAGERAHEDDYERGVHDGRMLNKRAEHYVNDLFKLQVKRYGAVSRPVLCPVPEDFPFLLCDPGPDGAA